MIIIKIFVKFYFVIFYGYIFRVKGNLMKILIVIIYFFVCLNYCYNEIGCKLNV